jgi:hypothetical protein
MTYKSFLENHEDNKSLISAVKKQLDCNSVNEFFEELDNVSKSPCGANGGFTGFIYYTETTAFWRANKKNIKNLMEQEADELGESSVISMVKNFNSVKDDFSEDEIGRALYGKFDEDLYQLYDTFAKYALEEVAYWYDSDNE